MSTESADHLHDDDFDREARPRKKTGNGALVAMISLGVLLLGGMIFALVYFFMGNNLDNDMLAYMPADTNMMFGLDVEELLKNDKLKDQWKKAKAEKEGKEIVDKLKEADIEDDDISRILYGTKAIVDEDSFKDSLTMVIKTKKDYDKEKLIKAFEMERQEKNGKIYYKDKRKSDMRVVLPTNRLIVFLGSQKRLDDVLEKDASKVVISDAMRELAKKMSKGPIWLAIDRSLFGDELKNLDQLKGKKDEKGELLAPTELIDAAKDLRGLGMYVKVDGDKITVKTGMLCKDSDNASKAASALQAFVDKHRKEKLEEKPELEGALKQLPDEIKKSLNDTLASSATTSSGAMLESSISLNISGIEKVVKSWFEHEMKPVERRQIDVPVQQNKSNVTNPPVKVEPDAPKKSKDPNIDEPIPPREVPPVKK
ncbi:MAG: hypothetical protein K8T89_03345 [Planctomycetes bacterium]|nr:hypothetical protein [Planctomycetota bacterium]